MGGGNPRAMWEGGESKSEGGWGEPKSEVAGGESKSGGGQRFVLLVADNSLIR